MGDQDMATFDNADWSEDSNMGECDPGAPLTDQASSDRYPDYPHASFAYKLKVQILPNDQENRGEFDNGWISALGIPMFTSGLLLQNHMKLLRMLANRTGNLLFGFILARMSHLRFLSTVYVLVDNRDLTNLDNPDPSLQHWPAVAAWWSSRACMQGPARELCDVQWSSFGPPHMGRHLRLAALCLVFPGLHIVLLDSDCVPVTLLKLKICGKKLSVYSIVGSQVQFQPAVGLGA